MKRADLFKEMGNSSDRQQGWDEERDLLVFGSGAAGMAGTLFASKKSLDVVLCEKSAQVGGTTASSGGVL